MENKRYIVVLEIASSHIGGIVAAKEAGDNDASIVCYHEVPISDCVRYGSIINVDEVCSKVEFLLDCIQSDENLPAGQVRSVYVALAGRSMHTEAVDIEKELPEGMPVSRDFIRQINRELKERVEKGEVLDIVPRSFQIDGGEIVNPVGSVGSHLYASMNVILCRPQTRRNLQMVFDRLGIAVNGFIISPLAAAKVLLTEEERQLGCMFVDHGAETTTVSIYKNNRLMYLSVLPMGSRNITKDLVSLNILEESAEKIKCNYGDAMSSGVDLEKLDIAGVSSLDVANYVTARCGEIMENVYNRLHIAQFTPDQLPAGIVAVGRGMRLTRMPDLMRSIFSLPVRIGAVEGLSDRSPLYGVPQLLSIVSEVASYPEVENCLEQKRLPEFPEENPESEPDDDDFEDEVGISLIKRKKPAGKPEKGQKKPGFMSRIFKTISSGIDSMYEGDDDEEENEKTKKS